MKNVIFHAIDKGRGKELTFTLNDLYGYEGEVCGVFIKETGVALNYNSGWRFEGMNPDLDIIDVEVKDC